MQKKATPKTILICGLGIIGGSLAKAIKAYTPHRVLGMNRSPEPLQQALACGAIDAPAREEDLPNVDIVFLCAYPAACVAWAEKLGPHLKKGCIVCDACGIKTAICEKLTAISHRCGFIFVGGHPMAGKERNGFEASDGALFQNASYILVPCDAPDEAVEEVKALALSLGFGSVTLSDPKHHDRMIAYTSQLPHVLACAYVRSPSCPQHRGFSAGSYHDVSRVARINETMWTELFLENREPLLTELDLLITHLQEYRRALAQEDADTLRAMMKQARLTKEELGE